MRLKAMAGLVIAFLSGCSNYASMKEVKASDPMLDTEVSVSLNTAYSNLVTRFDKCHGWRQGTAIHKYNYGSNAEIAVLNNQGIWLAAFLKPEPEGRTRISAYWGNSNWEKYGRKVPGWADGTVYDC